jgi:hypothetical protein
MPEQTVQEFLPWGSVNVFFNCQCPDVTKSAFIQVTNRLVVQTVVVGPFVVRGKGKYPAGFSYDNIQLFRLKKGTVSTIVKDDEYTDQESGIDQYQWDGKPY